MSRSSRTADAGVLSYDDVVAAAARLDGVVTRTPVLRSRTLDERVGASVFVKAESFQRSGAFKFRGAYSRLSAIPPDERGRGVVAVSSGNHGGAVALAASLLGMPATIVVPADAPPVKVAAIRGYGAHVVTYDRWSEDRDAAGRAVQQASGATFVPPYDDLHVMAGQGTAALELLDDVGELDALVTPVSGGGLMAGCSTVARHRVPGISIHGVEPEAGDDTRRSLEAGHRIELPVPRTIADGLQVTTPGELTFPVLQERIDGIATVTDDELVDTMMWLFERMKIVAEPSGAAAIAGLLTGAVPVARGARVGVVLSGGNVGAARFGELVAARTSALAGRRAS